MATGGGGEGLFRGVYDGCIVGNDTGIQQRPYHRNCSCALHKSRGHCSHVSPKNKVSYPMRRAWSETCLALMASGQSSPCNSPAPAVNATGMSRAKSNLALSNEDDDVDH